MRRLVLFALYLTTAASARPHARPNFTGTWVLDTAVLGRQTGWTDAERVVVQTESTISIRQHNVWEMRESVDSLLLPTNGEPRPQRDRAGVTNSARWAGDTLVLTTHGDNPPRKWDDVRRWTLVGPAMLRVDQVVHVNGKKMRDEGAVFRRQ